jgi:hypothetical protein
MTARSQQQSVQSMRVFLRLADARYSFAASISRRRSAGSISAFAPIFT